MTRKDNSRSPSVSLPTTNKSPLSKMSYLGRSPVRIVTNQSSYSKITPDVSPSQKYVGQKKQQCAPRSYFSAALRVFNQVDYSLMNEFAKIKNPTAVVEHVGRMMCRFLHIVKYQGQSQHELRDHELGWSEIQALVRKGVVKSIFEFKEQIKAVVSAP